MPNDSIETLLLRHYGNSAAAPAGLEKRLITSVQHEVHEQRQAQQRALRLRERRVSRRQAMRMVALGSTGVSLLTVGISSLEQSLFGAPTSSHSTIR